MSGNYTYATKPWLNISLTAEGTAFEKWPGDWPGST